LKAEKLTILKKELLGKTSKDLVDICLQLAKLKVDNKEMLTYLLFDADDPMAYAQQLKEEMEPFFQGIKNQPYLAVKQIRKAGKLILKYNRYTKHKEGELDLWIHFAKKISDSVYNDTNHKPLQTQLYRALQKSSKIIPKLHEDLQYDYQPLFDEQQSRVKQFWGKWDHYKFPLNL
jgi:hypothetical protein